MCKSRKYNDQRVNKQLYAKPKLLGDLFNCSYSTIYRLLKSYDDNNLGVDNMYFNISGNLTLVNIEKFEQYLQKKHQYYQKGDSYDSTSIPKWAS